ncbi:MAG: HlyD family efflux transporter periplasmic adaptor subunit [Gammaproteobacteria bacterium]|nr:HlyD family efflux transporter periplasmic adaptor subunit [Gammaproteobacteria bacterium]
MRASAHDAPPHELASNRADVALLRPPAVEPGAGETLDKKTQLLRLEAEAREQRTVLSLLYHLVNETRDLLGFDLAFVFRARRWGPRFRLEYASSIDGVERDAPLVRGLERMVNARTQKDDPPTNEAFEIADPQGNSPLEEFGFRHALWIPMRTPNGAVVAGLLLLRAHAWSSPGRTVAQRLTETYAHAWNALEGPGKLRPRGGVARFAVAICALLCVPLMWLPVDMSALAPASIVAAAPFVVAAPTDGIVAEVLVEPYSEVRAGQALVALDQTVHRNDFAIAERTVMVAAAKYRRASQVAIGSRDAKRELAVAKAELALAKANRDYAKQMLERTVLRAPQAGIAIFSDRRDWANKPVRTGDELLRVADPMQLKVHIDLPVTDAVLLKTGADVQLFLDADPLHPVPARVEKEAYHARITEQGVLAYAVTASLSASPRTPKIGWRGTAKLRGETVPLYLLIFRRPITAVRQALGI